MAIGVSLASYLPWTAVSAWRVAQWARRAGYTFLQVLPFRTVHIRLAHILPPRYVEEAWNPAYTRRGPDPKTPVLLHDRLLFPSPCQCCALFTVFRALGAQWITHDVADLRGAADVLLEVHPGLWLTPERIVACSKGPRLVLDLFHLRRSPRRDELAHRPSRITTAQSLLGDWRTTLPLLLPFARLVHVSPNRRDATELTRFLECRETELETMLLHCRAERRIDDYVAEVKLPLAFAGNPSTVRETLQSFRARLATVLEY